jgi:hypothetical protein
MGSQGYCNGWNHQHDTARDLSNQAKITSYQSTWRAGEKSGFGVRS